MEAVNDAIRCSRDGGGAGRRRPRRRAGPGRAALLGARSGEATDINESGQVVGNADGRAFVYDRKGARFLDVPGATFLSANAINDAGVIAGAIGRPGDSVDLRAYLLRHGGVQTLPEPLPLDGGFYRATALNNAGHAVVLWRNGNGEPSGSALYLGGQPLDLGAETFAQDLNHRDWAAGYSEARVGWARTGSSSPRCCSATAGSTAWTR